MRPISSSPVKIEFITERLRQGLGRREIFADYKTMWSDSQRSFDRVLKYAKDVVARERAELERHRLELLKSEETQMIRAQRDTVLHLQNIFDQLYDNFFAAKTVKEQIDTALAIVKVVAEINRMQGYYSTSKSEVCLDVVPQENVIGKYFEQIDARLKEEREREMNGALNDVCQ